MSEPLAYLPDGIVQAWAVNTGNISGHDGESIAIVLVTVEFQVSPEHSARQTFVFHKEDANKLRRDMKRPPKVNLHTAPPSEEDTQ